MHAKAASILLLVGASLGAGCLSNTGPDAIGIGADHTHPWPAADGTEWPLDLEGPFELLPDMPVEVRLPSHDGVELGGWVFVPALPEGVGAPTIVLSSPYTGLDLDEAPNRDSWGAGPIDLLVENGYAVAAFSVRGTGISGGCFENKGLTEQLDQVAIVEWAANQSWSNGRVGMMGISYPATTPLMAAIHGAPSLKTIIPIAPVTDVYTELHSTQGALYTSGAHNEVGRRAAVALLPSASDHSGGEGPAAANRVADGASRLCADYAEVMAAPAAGWADDDRNPEYWLERSLVAGFPNVTASVYFVHGLLETAHPIQEDVAWEALALGGAPTAMMLGQWDHEVPRVDDWAERALAWLDFWLKGVGPAPDLDVEFQDSDGTWHTSAAWPPREARGEVLYLSGGDLAPEPGHAAATFQSAPAARLPTAAPAHGNWPLCDGGTPTSVVFETEPLPDGALIAGNPFALLHVESDLPGGLVSLFLYRVPSDGSCEDADLITTGSADLRFHAGNLVGVDFPTDEPTPVRVDLMNLVEQVPAGDRLVLVVNRGEYATTAEAANPLSDERFSRSGQPYYPSVTLHAGEAPGASHLVLPLLEGSLGGGPPVLNYPPRPFLPSTV